MKKAFAVLLIILIGIAAAPRAGELHRGLGFAAGMVSGLGFSHRWWSARWGGQVTLGALSRGANDPAFSSYRPLDESQCSDTTSIYQEYQSGRYTSFNTGLQFLYRLHASQRSRFYAFGGGAWFWHASKEYVQDYHFQSDGEGNCFYESLGERREHWERDSHLALGVGIGMEWFLTKAIHLGLELPLTWTDEGDLIMYIPQASIHYWYR